MLGPFSQTPHPLYQAPVTTPERSNAKQGQVLHVHLVGDGKAGKSVAAQWLIELFQNAKNDQLEGFFKKSANPYQIDKENKRSIDVERGRTRGVNTTTLRFQDQKYDYDAIRDTYFPLPPKDYVIMIHDYGGQEEFLSNHANFLATDNSVYLIVVPVVQVGESIKEKRLRSITEMMERYLFWCRFVFSVIRREQAFPVVASSIACQPSRRIFKPVAITGSVRFTSIKHTKGFF
jgi:hypothetical protein